MELITCYIISIALLTSWCCTLPGNFLILRGNALISDAISHSILLGIVISFIYTKTLHSPLLFAGALIMSMFTVTILHQLEHIKLLYQDAAIALLFPFFFACAVIIINLYAHDVHIDTDAVLLGELALTPFDTLTINGYHLGPIMLWIMLLVFALNACFIFIFYKELALVCFDQTFAQQIQYLPRLWSYLLLFLLSISIIASFQAAGTIVVLSSIIVPPASARILTTKLKHMIIISILLSTIGVLSGYLLAHQINGSIAGAIATMHGCIYILIYQLNYAKD